MYEIRPGAVLLSDSELKHRCHRIAEENDVRVARIYGEAIAAGIDTVESQYESEM